MSHSLAKVRVLGNVSDSVLVALWGVDCVQNHGRRERFPIYEVGRSVPELWDLPSSISYSVDTSHLYVNIDGFCQRY